LDVLHLFLEGLGLVRYPLEPTVAIRVRPDQSWASECPDVKNYKWRLNPVWHRMHYSCTRMATVGFKGLTSRVLQPYCVLGVKKLVWLPPTWSMQSATLWTVNKYGMYCG